jgi:NADH dehydrogenase
MVASKPRIVILGAGFGGLFTAQALDGLDAHLTLIDRHNYHLFQPLLYQVATAGLPPSDISWPIRSILRKQSNIAVLMDEVIGIDTSLNRVELRNGFVGFDYLVVATGCRHSYFGHEEWSAAAPGLKSIDDATHLRRRILLAFERAEMLEDTPAMQATRQQLLRFVIVGGGPTGVELAGTIAELAHFTLAADFRRIDPRGARVSLVEAGERILPAFQASSSDYASKALAKLGVEVLTGRQVVDCNEHGVEVATPNGNHRDAIAAATVIWAAGVKASPVGSWLGVDTDRNGRVTVETDLSIPDHGHIFVIGDAASTRDRNGRPVPGIAPAAKQQGRYVGRLLRARIAGGPDPGPFVYRHSGNLATIGRKSAVIEFPGLTLRGRLAWWIWGLAHIYFLVGVPSPVLISFRWLWEYLTFSRGARLITGTIDKT